MKFKGSVSPLYTGLTVFDTLIVVSLIAFMLMNSAAVTLIACGVSALILLIIDVVVLIPSMINTQYVLKKNSLFLQCGLQKINIAYDSILDVKKIKASTKSTPEYKAADNYSVNSPTILITHMNKNNKEFIAIAPANIDKFLSEVISRCNGIQNNN